MLNGHESDSSHDVSDLLSIINTHDLLSPLNAVEALYLHLPVGVDDEPSPDGSGIVRALTSIQPDRSFLLPGLQTIAIKYHRKVFDSEETWTTICAKVQRQLDDLIAARAESGSPIIIRPWDDQ